MSFLVFILAMALMIGAFLLERELTLHGRKTTWSGRVEHPWLHRVEYINRPAVIGFAMLGLGVLAWALPPHCDVIAGVGGIGVLFGCWVTEMRKKPVVNDESRPRYTQFLRYVHPRG